MMSQKKKNRLWLGPLLWLVVCLGFVLWCGSRTFYVGHMALPRSQGVAIGISLVTAGTVFLAWSLFVVFLVKRYLLRRREPSLFQTRRVQWGMGASFVLGALLFFYGHWLEPRWLTTREVRLPPESKASTSAAEKTGQAGAPIRVAVISDLHVPGPGRPWSQLAQTVNKARPDLVLFLGDSLNGPQGLPQLHQALGAMRAPHGKLAVKGNWENWYWSDLPLLRDTGFQWLNGTRSMTIRGIPLHLVGLPYTDQERGARGQRALARLPRDQWRLFLYHTPDLVEQVPAADVYLAGHTHGGQVSVPFFGALVTLSAYGKRFERGLARAGDTWIYVNPGIGVEPMIPLRLGVRPEVTLLLLGPRPRPTGDPEYSGRWFRRRHRVKGTHTPARPARPNRLCHR